MNVRIVLRSLDRTVDRLEMNKTAVDLTSHDAAVRN